MVEGLYLGFAIIWFQICGNAYSATFNCNQAKAKAKYDFIVVGSGPGGGTVASELASRNYKVLLIEAGPDYSTNNVTIPAFALVSEVDPNIRLDYLVNIYNSSANTRILYPRAAALGGCSTHNLMISVRMNPSEWNHIANVTGDTSWKNANMQKYWNQVENCKYCAKPNKYKGWLNVSLPMKSQPGLKTNEVLKALFDTVSASMPFNPNVNQKPMNSWFYVPTAVSKETGTRSYVYIRLKNVQDSTGSNLTIMTNTLVTKIIIENKTACGVQYVKGAYLYKATGGQYSTPQILQLSGIGDKTLLQSLGIKVKQHLP
ncbi:unnamed protein product, partial [Didymodactylos carnosus]